MNDNGNTRRDFGSMQYTRADIGDFLHHRIEGAHHSPIDFAARLVEIYNGVVSFGEPYFFQGYAVLRQDGHMFIVENEEDIVNAPLEGKENTVSFLMHMQDANELLVRFVPLVIQDQEALSHMDTIPSDSFRTTMTRIILALQDEQKLRKELRPTDPLDMITLDIVSRAGDSEDGWRMKISLADAAQVKVAKRN